MPLEVVASGEVLGTSEALVLRRFRLYRPWLARGYARCVCPAAFAPTACASTLGWRAAIGASLARGSASAPSLALVDQHSQGGCAARPLHHVGVDEAL